MNNILGNNVTVVKSFNNNIVLIREKGVEKILFQKGIGFGKKFGEIISVGTEVEKIFTINNEDNKRNFKEILNRVDDAFIGVCEEAIANIAEKLGEELNENIHIGLIDHLSFVVKRLRNDEEIENPFLVEIETLYAKEFELALETAKRIGEFADIYIPDGEVGFIALHIHSARNDGKLSNTIKYSYLSSTIVEHIEDSLSIEINRKSLDYARFLTHIRFAIERILTDKPLKNDLVGIIKREYPKAYLIAGEVAEILSKGLDKPVTIDEVAYLAMHIERFRVSLNI